ncbi:MAG: carboxypeptidase regulatory-like domain-containing protein [Acidobacteriota bacterium]
MKIGHLVVVGGAVLAASLGGGASAAAQTGRGTVRGHVRLIGELPGNPVIRMSRDPMCAQINSGKRVIQETVMAALDGSMANVFVQLEGSFPDTPVPTEPVTIDQRGCVYTPRVVGVRLGQVLQVRNSDNVLHNVHGLSGRGQGFNVGQPLAGMVNKFPLTQEETMLKLSCDVHTWMRAYIGVVKHPYFAVTAKSGTFEIAGVPGGSQTIQAWHEQYGPIKKTVVVKPGGVTTVDFAFSAVESAPVSGRNSESRRGRSAR